MSGKCVKCGSYAINHNEHGRDGSDGDLCDVCYWRKRAVSAAWISVDERSPAEGSWVTFARIFNYEVCAVAAGEFYNGNFHLDESGLEASNYDGGACIYLEFTPTHWMPLPEAPTL